LFGVVRLEEYEMGWIEGGEIHVVMGKGREEPPGK